MALKINKQNEWRAYGSKMQYTVDHEMSLSCQTLSEWNTKFVYGLLESLFKVSLL